MNPIVPARFRMYYDQLHFAPAVADGDRLFMSGVIGNLEDGTMPEDPLTQFRQAFENVGVVLGEAGLQFADIVEFTSYHVGLQAHMGAFLQAKDEFLKEPYPAWTAIGITELAMPGALVELKVTIRQLGS